MIPQGEQGRGRLSLSPLPQLGPPHPLGRLPGAQGSNPWVADKEDRIHRDRAQEVE